MKLKTYKLILSFFLTVGGLLFLCCNNEDEPMVDFKKNGEFTQYLSIDNYSEKTEFNQSEKQILREALYRVKRNISQNGSEMFINKDAHELNMSCEIYEDLSILVEIGNMQGFNIHGHRIMKRSEAQWDIDPCGWAQSYINDYLEEKPGGSFAQECFNNYWSGTGDDMPLTSGRFNDITSYVQKPTSPAGMNSFLKNGKVYYQSTCSFYGTPYQFSLGSATIVYDSNMNPVGLSDTYDFNPMEWGERDVTSEAMTRAVNIAGTICDAKSFNISYGITK